MRDNWNKCWIINVRIPSIPCLKSFNLGQEKLIVYSAVSSSNATSTEYGIVSLGSADLDAAALGPFMGPGGFWVDSAVVLVWF
jgi:hypothetical protein